MIRLKPELFQDLDTVDGLRTALQAAIQLEFATIPPYLYALYSLKPDTNQEIQELIISVATEEMLHMALACNLLNAVGGNPIIYNSAVVPSYPGHLPGSVESSLVIPLKRFSSDLVATVFMVIEVPEKPIHFQGECPLPSVLTQQQGTDQQKTIGDFYASIKENMQQLVQHGFKIFTGDPARQVARKTIEKDRPLILKRATHHKIIDVLFEVKDLASATKAIDTIIEQGEGSPTSVRVPDGLENGELPHYYRFAEIYCEKELLRVKKTGPIDQQYVFSKDHPVTFDPKGVWPLRENPKAHDYQSGSPARQCCDAFNSVFTTILSTLQETFNGNPPGFIDAVDEMQNLEKKAADLVKIDLGDGTHAGPSFEYFLQ